MRPRSITHEIAQEGHCLQRLPTEVEDVAPWIPRVSSKDSRIRHVHMQRLQGRRHRGVVRRRSHPQATGPNRDYIKSPILRPARCVHQHGLQAEFVLRCRGGGEREGIGQRWGSGGDGTTYRHPRCIRGGARVAPGVPARDTPARSKGRTFAPSWLFLGWIRKSGRRGTHGQLVAVLRPPPVRLRGLIPVLLPVRTEGKGRTSEPVREGARDGSRGRRRGNPRRGAIRWKNIRGSREDDGRGR